MTTATLIDPTKLTEQQLEDLLRAKKDTAEKNRNAYKQLVQQTVPDVVSELIDASYELSHIKAKVFTYFKDVLEMKAQVFGVVNNQQSHTFSTDKYGITIGYRVNDGWDDTVTAGVEKVNAFIQSLAQDPNSSKLVHTVFRLLKKDAQGNLRASRVLELKQMAEEYQNADFSDGVGTILKAYKPVRSCWFIDAYYINGVQQKVSIPLAISAVDFPDGFDFDFLKAVEAENEPS